MKDGFIKVAAATPSVTVADPKKNGEVIRMMMRKAAENGAYITVFPELCITGYTCRDLFFQRTLQEDALLELKKIAEESADLAGIFFVGLPLSYRGKLYNVAAAVSRGEVLGFVPKTNVPFYHEFYEGRQFTPAPEDTIWLDGLRVFNDEWDDIPFGTDQLFVANDVPDLRIAVELCEDLWVPNPPSSRHAVNGANVIVNLSASNALTGKGAYRKSLVENQSARLYCGYIYASAGADESTTDAVFSGHNLIAENGYILAESDAFFEGILYSEIDLQTIEARRQQMTTYPAAPWEYGERGFFLTRDEDEKKPLPKTTLTRHIDRAPFVPSDEKKRAERCEEIFAIQSRGLAKRLKHTNCKTAVLGISGGLDSTLALLVTTKAFDLLNLDRSGIYAVTMPGFGTTDRTYQNAVRMIEALGATFREIPIADAVRQHFRDISQDENVHDVTYENAQARERTQILMDLANQKNGLVVGTGDLSELALGWTTYNGDHIAMYGVNASVPKTLVRHLVKYYADVCGDNGLSDVLRDVLDTPVSPELLPPTEGENGEISQKTEELVGPYELHDFFLYHLMRNGETPAKIYRMARYAFGGEYDDETIKKWLGVFYRRFFSQQYKRSCLPDAPKVGTVSLSPRGDLRMPSDASVAAWLEEVERL